MMTEEASYQLVDDSIFIMAGAHPNETELQTVEKLAKTGEYYIIFPSDGQIKEIKAPNIILDITGKNEKAKLIGLRRGWSKRLRYVYLNYHGHWYILDRDKVFSKNWIPKMVK